MPTPVTPSPTRPPRMALPTPPPEMSRDDEAGAIAAATYFLTQLYPYTVSSHDTAAWRQMSHPSCSYCSGIVAAIANEEQAGTYTRAGEISVAKTSAQRASLSTYGIRIEFTDDHDTQWGRSGELIRQFPAQRLKLGVVVVRQDDSWVVRGVEVFSSLDEP
jgi:hypothetical protein